MKVLILHQHFNTPQKGGALRSYYLAKALVEKGVHVSIIAGCNEKQYRHELVEGIDVHYLPVPYDNRFRFIARSQAFIKYLTGAIWCSRFVKDVGLCYAISTPLTVGLAALWMKWRYKIPFIFEVGDLWPEAPIQLGYVKNYFFKNLLYQLEGLLYSQATSIVALSSMIKFEIEKTIPAKEVVLIPNMADTDFYRPEIKDEVLIKKYNIAGKFVVSYIGTLGAANGLDYFLECARVCQKANLRVQFLLCGDGAMLENIKKSSIELILRNFLMIPFQNREGVREIMNVTDAAFVCYKPFPILETGSPNKYFDGLASGKLIITNFGGWMKEEIENFKCGISVDAKHPLDFVKKINVFLRDQELLKTYQRNSRHLAETKYSRKITGEKFYEMFALRNKICQVLVNSNNEKVFR